MTASRIACLLLTGGALLGCSAKEDPLTPIADMSFALFDAQIRDVEGTGGEVIFDGLVADFPERLTVEELQRMATLAVESAKNIELTEHIMEYALERYPQEIGKFGGIDAALYRLKNGGPELAEGDVDHAALEALGY